MADPNQGAKINLGNGPFATQLRAILNKILSLVFPKRKPETNNAEKEQISKTISQQKELKNNLQNKNLLDRIANVMKSFGIINPSQYINFNRIMPGLFCKKAKPGYGNIKKQQQMQQQKQQQALKQQLEQQQGQRLQYGSRLARMLRDRIYHFFKTKPK